MSLQRPCLRSIFTVKQRVQKDSAKRRRTNAAQRIWVDNKVDFSLNKNLIVAAITLILGTGDFTLKFGQFALGGIGTATFGAIVLYALLNRKNS